MPPGVEICPAEEQLATGACLFGRDRSLGSQATEAVAVDSEVLGGIARIEPGVDGVGLRRGKTRGELVGDEVGQLTEQVVEKAGAGGTTAASVV